MMMIWWWIIGFGLLPFVIFFYTEKIKTGRLKKDMKAL